MVGAANGQSAGCDRRVQLERVITSQRWATGLAPLDQCPPKGVTEKAPHDAGNCDPVAGRKRAGACSDASKAGMPERLCNWCGDFITACQKEQASQVRLDQLEKALNDPL